VNKKHDHQKVLQSGLNLICTKGYNSLGVDEICKTTGMTKGAFYNAFKSKEQFLLQTITLYGENNVKRIQAKLKPNGIATTLERLIFFYTEMLQIQPQINYTGCFVNNMMAELGITNQLVGKATAIEFQNFMEAIEPTVLEAQNAGELTTSISSLQMTELIHSTFYGLLTVAKSTQNHQQSINTINLLFNNLKINK
jgi:TetR/AcrR family transcriptional repressor of nem operon